MRKIALFVEGATELIFVREYLLKWFAWDVDLLCLKIQGGQDFPVPYDNERVDADLHVQIIDVGGGGGILSYVRKNAERLQNLGYEKIICLADMYDDFYKQMIAKKNIFQAIDEATNQAFYAERQEAIAEMNLPIEVSFCFAIMEIEAWLLGKIDVWQRLDERLDENAILQIFAHNEDPEKVLFHPSNQIKQLLASIDKQYNKHATEIASIVSIWQKEDFETLLKTEKCNSFNLFHYQVTNK